MSRNRLPSCDEDGDLTYTIREEGYLVATADGQVRVLVLGFCLWRLTITAPRFCPATRTSL